MTTLAPQIASEARPAKPSPFFGLDYYQSLAQHVERGHLVDRLMTLHVGSTALGKLVDKAVAPELATRINSVTALKLAHAARSWRAAKARLEVDKGYQRVWDRFQAQFLAHAAAKERASVVQIGAYDGKTNDRLRPLLVENPHWHATLVEPMPAAFAGLSRNYARRPNTTLVNAAVTDTDGQAEMFNITVSRHTPLFLDQTATTKTRTLESFQVAGVDVESTLVPTVTLKSLFEGSAIDRSSIDLLFIDAEGCDADILRQMAAMADCRPPFIVAEHDHMSAEEYNSTVQMLVGQGYVVSAIAHDILAQRPLG